MGYPEQVVSRPQSFITWKNVGTNKGFIKFALLAAMGLASLGPA